jgi:hypothetical protein
MKLVRLVISVAPAYAERGGQGQDDQDFRAHFIAKAWSGGYISA